MESTKIDMLNGSIYNKLPRYALPIALTGILEQLFNASDVAIVGNFASMDRTVAIAAVGANSPIIGMILNLFIGISLGTNVVIANAIGRKDKKEISQAIYTSIIMAIIGGIIMAIVGEGIIGYLLHLLSVPKEVYPYALIYMRYYLLGMPVIFLYNFETAVFRSTGDTKTPLLVLIFSGILNVLLNLFFVIVFKMNVNGVAIATVIANAISAIILFCLLLKRNYIISLYDIKLDKYCLKKILKIGLPAGIQSAVFNLANIVIQSAVNSLGTEVMAASSAAFNIEMVVYYTFNSFSQACTTFVGQNYGAKQIKRCKRILGLCLLEDFMISLFLMMMILMFGRSLLGIFNSHPEVIEIGYSRLKLVFLAYLFSMLYEVMSGYLRGFGISFMPAIVTILGVCGLRILWVYFVFEGSKTFFTLMMVYPVSLALTAILIFILLIIDRPAYQFEKGGNINERINIE